MSTLSVSNITDGTDTVETGYVVNGSAKAWNTLGSDVIIDHSFNISSVVDQGGSTTGRIDHNFTNAMNYTKFCCTTSGMSSVDRFCSAENNDATKVITYGFDGTTRTLIAVSVAVMGDLA